MQLCFTIQMVVIHVFLAILSFVVMLFFFFLFYQLFVGALWPYVSGSHSLYCILFQSQNVCSTVCMKLNDDDDDFNCMRLLCCEATNMQQRLYCGVENNTET